MLAAGSLPLISGAPVPSFPSKSTRSLTERSANQYTVFGGNGKVSDGWPSITSWISSFEDMYVAYT